MIWAIVFATCMPDALRGPDCHELTHGGFASFAACEINRPLVRRMMRSRFDAAGWGAASIDAGRCVVLEPATPKPPAPPGELADIQDPARNRARHI